jgi:hypothetical protein
MKVEKEYPCSKQALTNELTPFFLGNKSLRNFQALSPTLRMVHNKK